VFSTVFCFSNETCGYLCVHWGFNKIIGRVSIRALTNIIVHFAVIVIINFVCAACINSDSNNNGISNLGCSQ